MNKKFNFALTDNTTYTGKDALDFYSKALLEGDTKSKIKLIADVKSKVKLPRLDLTNILQASDCAFTDGGTSTLSQKTLEVCSLKVNLEFCTRDFEVNFLSEQLRPGSLEGQIPASFQDYILDQVALNINADLENLLWQGDALGTPGSLCDGFIVKFQSDINVAHVGGVALTAANIFAEIGKVYAAIPDTIINKPDLVIFVSHAAAKFYKQAIAAINPLGGTFNAGDYTLNYLGIPLVVAPGMPTSIMVAGQTSNFWYGTDLIGDTEDVLVIPQRDKSGAPTVRIVAEFKFGVEYAISEEIVFYQ
jgi:hypothetical protein